MNIHYIIMAIVWVVVLIVAFVAKSRVFIQFLPLFGIASFLYLMFFTIIMASNKDKPSEPHNKKTKI